MKITVGIPTKNRYEDLSRCLLSIVMQTYLPAEIIIVDDSDEQSDLREIPIYRYLFNLMTEKGIEWRVEYGQKKGQHFSHELIQSIAKHDWIFRIDDDCCAEAYCLEELNQVIEDSIEYGHNDGYKNIEVGAIAPLVLDSRPQQGRCVYTNKILDMEKPNAQWALYQIPSKIQGRQDHLYSCFLYKKGVAHYELGLSPVAHREETLFTYSIKRAGYDLGICTLALVRHFRSESGGIRSQTDQNLWWHDEGIFKSLLSLWNVDPNANKIVVLDCGIGDHYAFKHILKELQDRHRQIVIACCFNDVFSDCENLELISIADAMNMFTGCIDMFNIYRNMIDWNWKQNLVEAFRKLYLS